MSTWLVEWLGHGVWHPFAGTDNEAKATHYFERASREYPTDTLIRLRNGDTVLRREPANGCEACDRE
jgi:hypothetical protein